MKSQIQELRKRMGFSQADIADLLHISRQAFGMYERGERSFPTDLLCRFADLAGVSVDCVLGRDPRNGILPGNGAEAEVLTLYRQLDASGQREFLAYLRCEKKLRESHTRSRRR